MIRLSEAIRLGAMLRPQAFHGLYRNGNTCAFGAAYEAIGIPVNRIRGEHNPAKFWAWMTMGTGGTCPECGETDLGLPSIVSWHLNDTHRWTRQAIADYVATIEPQEADREAAAHVDELGGMTDAGLNRLLADICALEKK